MGERKTEEEEEEREGELRERERESDERGFVSGGRPGSLRWPAVDGWGLGSAN